MLCLDLKMGFLSSESDQPSYSVFCFEYHVLKESFSIPEPLQPAMLRTLTDAAISRAATAKQVQSVLSLFLGHREQFSEAPEIDRQQCPHWQI